MSSIKSKVLFCSEALFCSRRENSSKLVSILSICLPEFRADFICLFLTSCFSSESQISMYPIIELSGVFISCDTDKSSLWRLSISSSVSFFSFESSTLALLPLFKSSVIKNIIIRIKNIDIAPTVTAKVKIL